MGLYKWNAAKIVSRQRAGDYPDGHAQDIAKHKAAKAVFGDAGNQRDKGADQRDETPKDDRTQTISAEKQLGFRHSRTGQPPLEPGSFDQAGTDQIVKRVAQHGRDKKAGY